MKASLSHRWAAALMTSAGLSLPTALLSAGGCTNNSRPEHRRYLVEEKVRQETRPYSIFLCSQQLLDVPIFPDPVHNLLEFGNWATNDHLANIHGLALNRKTGRLSNIGNGSDGLFVRVWPPSLTLGRSIERHEVFAGSYKDLMRKYMIALDAAHFINAQNNCYELFSLTGTAQNSNSVAYTLIKAMGLEFPALSEHIIAPGTGRWLLPEGWVSYYETWEPPCYEPGFLQWYCNAMRDHVMMREDVIRREAPDPDRPFFFNPGMPFVSYEPLIIENPVQRWVEFKLVASESALTEPASPGVTISDVPDVVQTARNPAPAHP